MNVSQHGRPTSTRCCSAGGGTIVLSAVLLQIPRLQRLDMPRTSAARTASTTTAGSRTGRPCSPAASSMTNTSTNFTSFTVDRTLFTTSANGSDGFLFVATRRHERHCERHQEPSSHCSIRTPYRSPTTARGGDHDASSSQATSTTPTRHPVTGTTPSSSRRLVAATTTSAIGGLHGRRRERVHRPRPTRRASRRRTGQRQRRGLRRRPGLRAPSSTTRSPARPAGAGIMLLAEASGGAQGGHNVSILDNVVSQTFHGSIYAIFSALNNSDNLNNQLTISPQQCEHDGRQLRAATAHQPSRWRWPSGGTPSDVAATLMVENNTAVNNTTSGLGDTIEIVNRGDLAGATATMNVTAWGNTVTNQAGGTNHAFEIRNFSAGTQTMTLDLNAANVPARRNNVVSGEARVTNDAGTYNIEGMSPGAQTAAAVDTFLSARNDGAITVTGLVRRGGERTARSLRRRRARRRRRRDSRRRARAVRARRRAGGAWPRHAAARRPARPHGSPLCSAVSRVFTTSRRRLRAAGRARLAPPRDPVKAIASRRASPGPDGLDLDGHRPLRCWAGYVRTPGPCRAGPVEICSALLSRGPKSSRSSASGPAASSSARSPASPHPPRG